MARAPKKEDFVYDFLYVDARRLAHFLSQFSQYGHLTALTRSVNETSSSSGDLSIHVAKVGSETSSESAQTKEFDTQWIGPLTFLDEAGKRGMIVRGLNGTRIGQLVLVSGSLAMFDLATLKVLWNLPSAKAMLLSALAPQPSADTYNESRKARHQQTKPTKTASSHEIAFDLLKTMPHKIIATVSEGDKSAWSTLSEDGMMTPASDVMLKHGVGVGGFWRMVGVLDAVPVSEHESEQHKIEQSVAACSLGALGPFIDNLGPAIRGMLGRPLGTYGITPLLIFREVLA